MGTLEGYPLRATTGARAAMAHALTEYLGRVEFGIPRAGASFRFSTVFDSWAPFWRRAGSTSETRTAVVLPDRAQRDVFVPRTLERTWSGGDPRECGPDGKALYPLGDGTGDGFALVALAELIVPFVVAHRSASKNDRAAIDAVLEQVFVEDDSLLDVSQLDPRIPLSDEDRRVQPVRAGRLLVLPDYWSLTASFSLNAMQTLDSAASVRANRWVSQLEIEGRVQVCTLRRLRAMKTRVSLVVDGTPETHA